MTLNLTCQTNSLSAGPPYYVPQFNISWLYSTTAGYKVIPDGHFLIIKDFDCNLKYSRPVFCALKESPGDWTPSAFTYPHKQCKFDYNYNKHYTITYLIIYSKHLIFLKRIF